MRSGVIDLQRLVEHKRREVYPSHVHYRVLVPVGESVRIRLEVPRTHVYIVTGEVHDVPSEYFTHKCWKDGKLVLPETLIDGTSMVIEYPEPFIVEREWVGEVRNVSHIYRPPGEDAVFRLRVIMLVAPRWLIDELSRAVESGAPTGLVAGVGGPWRSAPPR